jgi:hypothetical protein
MGATKPTRLPLKPENIPEELKTLPHWVVWKWEQRDGKWTKPPYQTTGKLAKSNDPKTWASFEDVLKASENGSEWDGVGFMLDRPYVGLDLDDCRNKKSGAFRDWARAILLRFNSYAEVSPSGEGAKILLRANYEGQGYHNDRIGLFSKARYFCITGHVLKGCHEIRACQSELEELIKQEWPGENGTFCTTQKQEYQQPTAPTKEDLEIYEKACNAANGEKFARLWAGKWEGDYRSPSEADAALCSLIAFWTQDPVQIERIVRGCEKLYREKWNRADYLGRTIKNILKDRKETFQEKKGPEPKKRGFSIMSTEAMAHEFGKEVEFLWRDYIPKAAPCLFAGREKNGKSTTVAQISKEIVLQDPSALVVWIATEGFVSDHADKWNKLGMPDRVVMLRDDQGNFKLSLDRWKDQEFLDMALAGIKEQTGKHVAAVVIDSVRGMQGVGENDPKMAQIMGTIAAIVCDKHKAACVFIAHHKKGKADSNVDKVAGGTGITSSVRAVYTVTKFGEFSCKITPDAHNALGVKPKSYRSVLVEDDDGFSVHISADDEAIKPSAVAEAEKFLMDMFKEQPKYMASTIFHKAAEQGLSRIAIRRAKERFTVRTFREEVPGPWFWECFL